VGKEYGEMANKKPTLRPPPKKKYGEMAKKKTTSRPPPKKK
jgi:hypothetical protein